MSVGFNSSPSCTETICFELESFRKDALVFEMKCPWSSPLAVLFMMLSEARLYSSSLALIFCLNEVLPSSWTTLSISKRGIFMLLLPIWTKWLGIKFLCREARFFSSDREKLFRLWSWLQCCSITLRTSNAAFCLRSIEFSASIAERSGRPMPNPVQVGEAWLLSCLLDNPGSA